jgi:hypothetical protein
VQLVFLLSSRRNSVLKQRIVLSPQNEEATLTSQEFVLKSRARALLVRHSTDVANNWLSLNTTLVEKNTGEAYLGECRKSATTRASTTARAGPRDRRPTKWSSRPYRQAPTTSSSSTNSGRTMRSAVVDTLEVVRNPVGWSNFVLLLIFLAIFPLVSRWRRNAFEARRWSESDLGGGQATERRLR